MRNDTDSDKISDFFEAMNGTDPLLADSNYDGIYDFDEINVTLDLDEDGVPNAWDFDNDGDASEATIAFGAFLGNYSHVTIFDADSFRDVEDEYQYVVLVGRPSPSATGTAGLVYSLLEDTGSMLTKMMNTDSDNIAVRIWSLD